MFGPEAAFLRRADVIPQRPRGWIEERDARAANASDLRMMTEMNPVYSAAGGAVIAPSPPRCDLRDADLSGLLKESPHPEINSSEPDRN